MPQLTSTPGPWHPLQTKEGLWTVVDDLGYEVCDPGAREADVRLIAAAPALLECLRMIHDAILTTEDWTEEWVMREAAAVIRQAAGAPSGPDRRDSPLACEHLWHRFGFVNGVPDYGCQKCGATRRGDQP